MSAYLENAYAALRARINAVWTDVTADGIWETEHLEMIPWEDLTPPYAVIHIASMPLSDEWSSMHASAYNPQIDIYYVAAITGPSGTIRAKLEALRDDLIAQSISLSAGQVLDVRNLTWANNIEPNLVFVTKDYTHRAGVLTVDYLIGEYTTV
jgi:hypothetical protein